MIFYLLVLLVLIAGIIWLGQLVLAHPGTAVITWGAWSLEMKTATLISAILLACVAFYLLVVVLRRVLGLRKGFSRLREARLGSKANRALTQGLVQFTEGHWEKAEKLLVDNAPYGDAPLLHYLAAARAAQMQEAYERRDALLKQAIVSDSKASIAVGVSQADMQLQANQLAQAHATLVHLRTLAPKHPYVLRLLAKTLYRQKNWEELLALLPELLKQNLLQNDKTLKFQAAALQGLLNQYAQQQQVDRLQAIWKKLPASVRDNQDALLIYAGALHQAGASQLCASLLATSLNKQWDERLVDLYGRIAHPNLTSAIQQAEKWQAAHAGNPACLLMLARLYRQQKLWGLAKSHYESSLNQAPNTEGYLELAELLESMNETENAQRCYRLGLHYCLRQESEKLALLPTQRQQINSQPHISAPTL